MHICHNSVLSVCRTVYNLTQASVFSDIEITFVLLAEPAVSFDEVGLNGPGAHVCCCMTMDGHIGEPKLVDAAPARDQARSPAQHQPELVGVQPRVLDGEGSVLVVELPLVVLRLAVLVHAELARSIPLKSVAVEEYSNHFLHRRVLTYQQTFVLGLVHEHTVMDPHQAALLHLQGELALTPGVAEGQLGGTGVLVEDQGPGHRAPRPADHYVHGEVEQLGVPVLHLVLGEELPDEVPRPCVVSDTQGFVLDVGAEAGGEHLDGHAAAVGGTHGGGLAAGGEGAAARHGGGHRALGVGARGAKAGVETDLGSRALRTLKGGEAVGDVGGGGAGLQPGAGVTMFQHLGVVGKTLVIENHILYARLYTSGDNSKLTERGIPGTHPVCRPGTGWGWRGWGRIHPGELTVTATRG